NEYSLKDKNQAKTDKTKNGNGKSVKSQSQSQQVYDEAETEEILLDQPVPHLMGQGFNGSDYTTWGPRKLDGYDDGFILLTQQTQQAATESLYSAIYMKLISSLKFNVG
ncbi:hypothetical protein Tco_1558450, partial [Tanacetum coccineum]